MALIQVHEAAWVDPQYTRIALITHATEPERRCIWIVSKANPALGIEVATEFQEGLLKALNIVVFPAPDKAD